MRMHGFIKKKKKFRAIKNHMEQLELCKFCSYLEEAKTRGMRMEIREIETVIKNGKRERIIRPWFPLSYHNASLFWHDTTIIFPLMDREKKKMLMKNMRFRLDPLLGKADIRQRESSLYLQIKIEIPDTL